MAGGGSDKFVTYVILSSILFFFLITLFFVGLYFISKLLHTSFLSLLQEIDTDFEKLNEITKTVDNDLGKLEHVVGSLADGILSFAKNPEKILSGVWKKVKSSFENIGHKFFGWL